MADIELVIKIPEEDYNFIKTQVTEMGITNPLKICITKGTPLPKGHKRLIEDNFKVGPVFDEEGNIEGYQYVTQEDLNNALTIIEADKAESEDADKLEMQGVIKRKAGTPREDYEPEYDCEDWIP